MTAMPDHCHLSQMCLTKFISGYTDNILFYFFCGQKMTHSSSSYPTVSCTKPHGTGSAPFCNPLAYAHAWYCGDTPAYKVRGIVMRMSMLTQMPMRLRVVWLKGLLRESIVMGDSHGDPWPSPLPQLHEELPSQTTWHPQECDHILNANAMPCRQSIPTGRQFDTVIGQPRLRSFGNAPRTMPPYGDSASDYISYVWQVQRAEPKKTSLQFGQCCVAELQTQTKMGSVWAS